MATLNLSGAESGGNEGEAGFGLTGTGSVQSTTKRTGGFAFRTNPTTTAAGYFAMVGAARQGLNVTTFYARFYFRYATKPGSNDEIIFCANHTAVFGQIAVGLKFELRLNSSGNLVIYDAAIGLVATGSTALSQDTWYRLEVKIIKGTSGSYEIKIDGTAEMSGTINTDSDTAVNINQLFFGKGINRNGQTVDFFYDDILVSDSAFPGAGECKLIKADGNGTYTAWTGTSADVDDIPAYDSDGTFISTSDDPNAETATMESSATGGISGTINCVKSNAVVRTLNTVALQARLRSGSTDDDSASLSIANGTTYIGLGKCYDTNPSGGAAWTTGAIDGIEVGVEHNQSQTREARATAFYAMVDYTPAGATDYPLNAGPGSFAISGSAATLLADRMINAGPGTFNWTGFAAELVHGFVIDAQPGVFSVDGIAASLLADRMINAAPGSFSVTGFLASLLADRMINAGPGSFNVTGFEAALNRGFALDCQPGVFSVTGFTASLLADRMINAAPAAFVVTGFAAELLKEFVLDAQPGVFLVTGFAASLLADRMINAQPGSFSLTGFAAELNRGFALAADPGAFLVTGQGAQLLADRMLNAEVGAFLVTGSAAALLADRLLSAAPGIFLVDGFAAELLVTAAGAFSLDAEPGSFLVSGAAASLLADRILNAEPGSFSITGFDADLEFTTVGGGGGSEWYVIARRRR